MLTINDLSNMQPHQVIDSGLTIDNRTGINMSNSDQVLRWVAVRGGIADWAIYIGLETQSTDEIMRCGDKIFGQGHIQRLVHCDSEALKRYRR